MTHVLTEDVTFVDSLYADPSLTITDIIIIDTTDDDEEFNLYDYPNYTLVFGSEPITVGDSVEIDGTVYGVDSITTQLHYFGTHPDEPGEVVDMGIYDFLENQAFDTVRVQDPFQSWFALGLGNNDGLWLTRNSLRFSALHDGFLQAGGDITGQVTEMEFSKDGDHLFVGTNSGAFYRLSGLNKVYSPNPDMSAANGNVPDTLITWQASPDYTTETTFEQIANFNGPVTGITIEKGNPDHVVVALGGYNASGRIQESTDATDANPNFGSVGGIPTMPCLSVLMDRNDPDIVFVGTDFGLWRTENFSAGTPTWEYCESPFGTTPIFDLKQNWRTWDEGCYKPGQIYIGTHGRGIWTTDEYLSIPEAHDNIGTTAAISEILLYPNPVINNASMAFDVKEAGMGNVRVYSLTGKLIMDMPVSLNAGHNTIALEAAGFANGTYIVSLTSGTTSKTTKFIKQ